MPSSLSERSAMTMIPTLVEDWSTKQLSRASWMCCHPRASTRKRESGDILIDSDVPQDLPIVSWVYGQGIFGPQHNSNLYAADLAKLVRFANDDNSPFAWTDASKTQHSALASALRSGTVYEGLSVAIAVGQPGRATP